MHLIFLTFALFHLAFTQNYSNDITGAWKGPKGVIIFTDGFFSYTEYQPKEFKFTYGGLWTQNDGRITFKYEFYTSDPDKVGTTEVQEIMIESNTIRLGEQVFVRIDDGSPGKLAGAWLFNNRIRDGQLGNSRSADNPRKTMKILSGTRFQWIAYNTETKTFHGTGGGTYTTESGKYTENIDFFSRDNNRVGASLEFNFEIKGLEWHHSGLSSSGDPMYEIWKHREKTE
jgi:hypothetical protein